ncbi:MAG TPA: hypothetical protein VN493_10795 [Thermoanaerobaculia bacterium]|nr:hypothetical protein [Thermoanaerobaculia bacterium]
MRLTVATRLVLCLVALAGIVLPEVAAAQCFGQCVRIAPGCRVCEESPTPTGVNCGGGPGCGCFFIPCDPQQPGSEPNEVQATLTELGLGAPVMNPASCLSASAEIAPPLAAPAN